MRTPIRRSSKQQGLTLVELLVSMIIMSVLSTMIIMTWTSLQKAFTFTVKSDSARQVARDTMSRMVTEIRDAQIPTSGSSIGQPPILRASYWEIRFWTSYGDPNGNVVLTRYRYRKNTSTGLWTMYRQRDTNGNGIIDSGDLRQTLATNVVNADPSVGGNGVDQVPIFTYTYYDSTGTLISGASSVSSNDLPSIVSINIRLISDLDPKHVPVYIDLRSTVQPRNLRQE